MLPAKPTLSFIIPAMNEEASLETLFEGIRLNASKISRFWSVIFIDDGSTDDTWKVMQRLAERYPSHVRAVRFSHNRGKADALALGYELADGEVIFTMDADLQDDPVEIPRFIEKLREGFDIVSGWKRRRHDPWHKVLPSRLFNKVLSGLVQVPLHDHNCGFKAYRREALKGLPMYGDMHRMVPSLASFEGLKTGEIIVQHHPRLHGVSKYGWKRLFTGLFDTTSVTLLKRWREKPMQFAGLLGFFMGSTGLLLLLTGITLSFTSGPAMGFYTSGTILLATAALVVVQGFALEHSLYYMKLKTRAPRPSHSVGGMSTAAGTAPAQADLPTLAPAAAGFDLESAIHDHVITDIIFPFEDETTAGGFWSRTRPGLR